MRTSPRGIPLWVRRLFHQRRADEPVRTGADLGWSGPEAAIVIGDHYQFDKLAAADNDLDRVHIADGYLRKIYKHLAYVASERGDLDLIDRADAECQRLTQEIVRAVEALRSEALARGYLDGHES